MQSLYQLLLNYVFALDLGDLGRIGKLRHTVYTGDAEPIRQPVRHISPQKREEVRALLAEMLDNGVIERSTSLWASPIVQVKKDGTTWFCVDYRRVNSVTREDAYPLPRTDTILDTLV
jgi:hypothetical protein